jgi:SSS family solute:Na+ symporter
MTPAAEALGTAAVIVAVALITGLIGGRHKLPNPAEFLVAGRSMGALLLWLLLGGEIYTAFTFLGTAGWAYGKGAPVYYIICYGPVAYVIAYFTMPLVWNAAKRYSMLTIGDFFAVRYGSRALGALVSVVGFVFLIPYVTLQMTGLQILLGIAGFGTIDSQAAVFIAVVVIAVFVFLTGLRGTAWTSVVKDAVAGIALPIHFFGSPAAVFERVAAVKPGWLTIAPSGGGYDLSWFVTTVILNGIAFFMFPQTFMSVLSAKSANTIRRNYVFLPLYQVLMMFMIVAGFTALLVMPGLTGPDVDKSFVLAIAKFYPPWVLGAIAGAGSLAALVPVSAQLLGASGLVAKNLFADVFDWPKTDAARTAVTRGLVLVLAAGALILWALLKTTLVELLLVAYNGMAQFLPGAAAALWWRRATPWGVAAGIGAGIAIVIASVVRQVPALFGINIGLVALAVNLAITAIVSYATPPSPAAAFDEFQAAAMQDQATD